MNRVTVCFSFIICIAGFLFSQNKIESMFPSDTLRNDPINYVFPVYDGNLDSFTMRQFSVYETSITSLFSRSIDSVAGHIAIGYAPITLLPKGLSIIIIQPFTHEEAHRSILTNLKIGSISQPFFNEQGGAYVKGVRDSELKNLRDTNLPMFIRLHTAGIESDYTIANKKIERICLKIESPENIFVSHYAYLSMLIAYQFSGIADSYLTPAKKKSSFQDEEENELERDIVGHDVYGMIRHLFRPDMDYSRYTIYTDLSSDEQAFAKRIGWRSLINLVQPYYIMNGNVFQITDKVSLSGSAGYCIAPFGDFIDENIFFKYGKFNISFYARQAQNRNSWFPAFGLGLVEYKPLDWFSATVRGHFWMQPENLDFNTVVGTPGGAGEVSLSFVLPNKNEGAVKGMGINIGALYKTSGFMPEIENHDAHFRMSAGLVVRF